MGQAAWVGPVPSGSASGDAAEGDLEAEGSELADVVGDLAAHVPLALVVVRAEILISHSWLLSITTAGTCQDRSQSASASTSRLVVPKLRVSLARRAGFFPEDTRIVATILGASRLDRAKGEWFTSSEQAYVGLTWFDAAEWS